MTRNRTLLIAAGAALMLVAGTVAYAQGGDPALQAALAGGVVGEKADGYMGLAKGGDAGLRAKVDAINIKRRAAYTAEAAKRGVTLDEWASAIGCQTLAGRVQEGHAYQLGDGAWRTKAGPIALPATCG